MTAIPTAAKAPAPRARSVPKLLFRIALVAFLMAVAVALFFVWKALFATRPTANVIPVSGRIEGDDSALASTIGGRVITVTVREGATVRKGDVIARLEEPQIGARVTQARASVLAARAHVQAAQDQIAVLDTQVAAAQANLAQSRASYDLAAFNKQSDVSLYSTGDVSEQKARTSISAAAQAASAIDGRAAEVAGFERQIQQQQATIDGAIADMRQAQGQLAEARANRSDLVVRAPFSGTVITRAVEPGEVIAPGTPVVTLLNLDRVYLRGFVPEGQIGDVKVGQVAHIYLDSNPNQPIDAYVLRIDPQAAFTPENTYFQSDRVQEVFGVELGLRSGFGFAKPGMPADGEILIRGAWPNSRPAT